MKSKNTIELNGRHYDATTGALLDSTPASRAAPKTIDGVFRTPVVTTDAATGPTPAQITRQAHKVAVHAKAHRTESSKTLMRGAVKRPEPQARQHAQGALQRAVPSLIATKQSVRVVDERRLARAKATPRNPSITHHATSAADGVRVLAAAATPLAPRTLPGKPGPTVPAVPAPRQTNKPLDIFEHAIANAGHFVDVQSRKHHFKQQARRHALSMVAGTLAFIVIASFALYQNTPGLQLKVASLRAGVPAGMPDFQAAGFAYNGVKAGDGTLAIGFSGKNGTYQLVQQPTNWNDSDMIQNIGSTTASGYPAYTTVSAQSTTVYRMGSTNATWVANGTWYTISGTHSLSDSQVAALVENI